MNSTWLTHTHTHIHFIPLSRMFLNVTFQDEILSSLKDHLKKKDPLVLEPLLEY